MSSIRNYIEFILDDKIHRINFEGTNALSPTTTLLNYLRGNNNHKGTKEGCAEGDCGACTVVIAEPDQKGGIIYKAYNSCLIFLPQIHGKQVITVENLAIDQDLHPVQEAMVEMDASQCGFCTPGFVMSMFALYKAQTTSDEETIRDAFAGNLCRCTGYQSILNAAHTALSSPAEDQFSKMEKETMLKFQHIDLKQDGIYQTAVQTYYAPVSLESALKIKAEHPDILMIGGATDVALRVTKKREVLPLILDLSHIQSLKNIRIGTDEIQIGSGVSLQTIKETLDTELPVLNRLLGVFGSKQIRQLATLGGNIGSASPIGDTLPALMAYGARVKVSGLKGEETIALDQFITGYRKTKLSPDQIITEIIIPKPDKACWYDGLKLSKRTDLDISTVCGAIRIIPGDKNQIKDCYLVYGGMAAFTKPAIHVQEFLKGKTWSRETIESALSLLEKDFQPLSDARAEAEGRMELAKNMLFKFWQTHQTL